MHLLKYWCWIIFNPKKLQTAALNNVIESETLGDNDSYDQWHYTV